MEVLPDLEEVQERMANAMETVDACSGSSEADVSAVMQAANAAAIAAASASTLVGTQNTCKTLLLYQSHRCLQDRSIHRMMLHETKSDFFSHILKF